MSSFTTSHTLGWGLALLLSVLTLSSFGLVPVDPPPAEPSAVKKRRAHRQPWKRQCKRLRPSHCEQQSNRAIQVIGWGLVALSMVVIGLVFGVLGMIWFSAVGWIILFGLYLLYALYAAFVILLEVLKDRGFPFAVPVLLLWLCLQPFVWGLVAGLPGWWITGLVLGLLVGLVLLFMVLLNNSGDWC